MKDLPNIDPSLLTPGTKSDRNLPIAGAAGFNPRGRSVRMMPELGMGYGGEPHVHKGIMTMSEIAAAETFVGLGAAPAPARNHNHYFKPCPFDEVDVYRVLSLFAVTDPCLQHAVKKLLVAGGRGAKDTAKDVREAIDALKRWEEMRHEEAAS